MRARLLNDVSKLKALSDRLSQSEKVTNYDKPDEPESWTIAIALKDIEESFIRVFDDHLPSLLNDDLPKSMVNDRLHAIGEEFRHIIYHIKDCKYYEYLWPETQNRAS